VPIKSLFLRTGLATTGDQEPGFQEGKRRAEETSRTSCGDAVPLRAWQPSRRADVAGVTSSQAASG
jgi:hypothetical protein